MHSQSEYIRTFLTSLIEEIGFELIDFKLEFGITNDGQLVLADEICPDTMRLWKDNQSYDKDLFRLDSGDLLAGYREVDRRLDSIV
jgi:phosphoribosylaminoimidazole-succinocarboxamide synthase